MQKIFIIGTIHGHTPSEELKKVVENLNPDQLLIELPEDAPEKFKKKKDIRDEMMFMYRWAKEKRIPVYLFDEYQPLFNDGMSVNSPEYKKFIDESRLVLEKYSWKDFNKSEVSKELDNSLSRKLFDPQKAKMREEKMLAKIKRHMISDGSIVIITGTSHLDFFKNQLPDIILPLR